MDNVWVILVWFMVTAIESFTYSVVLYIRRDPECDPNESTWWRAYLQFMDRTTNYQLWFIPMIWIYWPTKTNKQQNRSRKKAMSQLSSKSQNSGLINTPSTTFDEGQTGDGEETFSDGGYSSLDGTESYLDNDGRSEVSNNPYDAAPMYGLLPA
jgi:hypothetical protein